jgi:regulatory protein
VARTIALQRLTASARTRADLEQALARRNVPADAARRVLDRLERVGLVDDRAYAAAFVDSRRVRPGWSRSHISRWLADRGVDRDTVAEAVAALAAEDEHGSAVAFARSRWGRNRHLDPDVRTRRLLAALARRGYSAQTSRRAVAEVAAEEESQ